MKIIRVIITFSILLIPIYATCNTTASAFGDIYTCENHIQMEYDQQAAYKPILPVNMTFDIPIKVKYYIDGLYAKYIAYKYFQVGVYAYIHLFINGTPDWAEATISPNFMMIPATTDGIIQNATLTVKINRNAATLDKGIIKIRFNMEGMGAIKGTDIIKDVPITAGYIPSLGIEFPKGTVKSITPDETADFGIKLENLGNAKTNVKFRLLDIPRGWTVTLTPNIVLGNKMTGEDNIDTVTLSVKPPDGFGYHNEEQVIKVLIVPSYFGDDAMAGPGYEVSFIVKNKGFSSPGFEGIFVIFAIIIFVFIFRNRPKNINVSKKTVRGEDKK
ncbi:MAG: hypothetical protein NTV74_00265 [Euryarchaeota archaeon]|nr:hypothetical protein [Euryarchaeota archaeon]